jgi:hypothetical protein
VQIEKKPNPSVFPVPCIAGHDFPIALQHLADLPARMAMMRWTRGGDIPHPPAPPREMWRRAAWYGGLQTEFQSWLKAGGFHGAALDDMGDVIDLVDLDVQVTAINTTAKRRPLHK